MKKIFLILLVFSLGHHTSRAADLAGGYTMEVLGQGEIRYFGIFKIYEATLFTKGEKGGHEVLEPTTSRCLQLQYSISLSADDIIEGANAILSRQHSPVKLARVQAEIERFHGVLLDVKKNDRYLLCYDAANLKTTIFLNDKELAAVKSAEFGEIYFGIWLGPLAPIDEKLRDKLLNKSK